MISVVIPTRNRAHTLVKVLPSYLCQEKVTEIIIVDDAGEDLLEQALAPLRGLSEYAGRIIVLRHEHRQGASAGRITGYSHAHNEFVLFGEDDAYLEEHYAQVLLEKLQAQETLGIVAGRIIYLQKGEAIMEAKARFGNGTKGVDYLDRWRFSYRMDAQLEQDQQVPFTHALFLTRKSLLQKFRYDPHYCKGNGFREETDFQIAAFLGGVGILLTSETRCFHMNRWEVLSGGQRTNRFAQFYWNVYYTNYFYSKYHAQLSLRLKLPRPKFVAMLGFAASDFLRLFIKPFAKLLR